MTDRVGIFIDGPNLYSGAKRLTGDGQVDIPQFVFSIAAGRVIEECVYWSAQLEQSVNPTSYAGQRRFFSHIERSIPNARIGRASLQKRGNGRYVEKGVDVGVALDLVVGAYEDRWDVGIVVSGDGDMARAGRLVREMGKGFEVVCCKRTLSALLRAEANGLTVLDVADLMPFCRAE